MQFDCELSREANVVWFKNGKERLSSGDKYEMKEEGLKRQLLVKDIHFSDEARFTCQCGDAKTTANLSVQTVAVEFTVQLKGMFLYKLLILFRAL